jgi:hypothetical protein
VAELWYSELHNARGIVSESDIGSAEERKQHRPGGGHNSGRELSGDR